MSLIQLVDPFHRVTYAYLGHDGQLYPVPFPVDQVPIPVAHQPALPMPQTQHFGQVTGSQEVPSVEIATPSNNIAPVSGTNSPGEFTNQRRSPETINEVFMHKMSPERREIAKQIWADHKTKISGKLFSKFLNAPPQNDIRARNEYVNLLCDHGVKYADIRVLGQLTVAESTLRGIRRAHEKSAELRPRSSNGIWDEFYVWAMNLCAGKIATELGLDLMTKDGLSRMPWTRLANEMYAATGPGSFKFSPTAVHRRFELLDSFTGEKCPVEK